MSDSMATDTVDTGKKAFDFLKKPQGLVILALAGGAVYLWWHRSANATTVTDPTADQTPVGGYVDDRVPAGSASGSTPSVTVPTDNGQWQSQGLALLVGLAFDASAADTALNKYLGGESLTLAQKAMVSLVLARLGSPPNGAPSIVDEPPPTGGTTTPPGVFHKPTGSVTHIAQKGETWDTIINKYMSHNGRTTDPAAMALWSSLHGGSAVVTPGAKLVLPTSSPGPTGTVWS